MTYSMRWQSDFFPSLFFFETDEHNVRYGTHLHDTMEIGWSLSDNFGLGFRGQNYKMGYGDAAIISARELHGSCYYDAEQVKFASLHIPTAMIEKMFASNLLDPQLMIEMPPVKLIDGEFALNLYHELKKILPYTLSAEEQLQCIGNVLTRFLQFRRTWNIIYVKKSTHPAINHIRSIINTAYTRQLNFSRLATEVDLHERYLISLFKSAIGVPPHQYQIALRVERARQLLQKDLPLSDVAIEMGFSDQSHFNRHFKRCYGVPPGAFRNSFTLFENATSIHS